MASPIKGHIMAKDNFNNLNLLSPMKENRYIEGPGRLGFDFAPLVNDYHANKDLKNLLSDKFDEVE